MPNELPAVENPRCLAGLFLDELEELCASLGQPSYRARQILAWVHRRGAVSFEEMTDLPAPFRRELETRGVVLSSRVEKEQKCSDGTAKLLIRLADGNAIESVLIVEPRRKTVCLSTQVGCAIGCRFCASGRNGLIRNLDAAEIVEQLLHVRRSAGEALAPQTGFNLVFMGVGEPLANYDSLLRAVRILNASWGAGIGARRMTVSTIGMPRRIERLAAEELQINLAVSLHGPNDAVRNRLVPSERSAGVAEILAAAEKHATDTGREVTFEYVLVDGVNASEAAARELAAALEGLHCNVNVSPLNPTQDSPLAPPNDEQTDRFCQTLERNGVNVNLRKRKGGRIDAACGQLRACAPEVGDGA